MPLDSSGLATGPGTCLKATDADLQEASGSLPHPHKITSGKAFGISGIHLFIRKPFPASASFTHIENQDYQLLLTRLRSMGKNSDLQVKIRIID